MLHTADPKLTVNHVNFWLSEIVKSGIDFSILVRDEKSFTQLTKQFPKLQICYAKTPVDVETVVNAQPDLKVVLYTSNLARNIHLLRFNHLKHIFIGTKNSDWLSNYNKSYRAYDEFWAGGEYAITRFKESIKNIGHLKLKSIGKPQIKENILYTAKEQNTSLVLVEPKNAILEKIYFANVEQNLKSYIYLPEEKKDIYQNLESITTISGIGNKIIPVTTKKIVDEFAFKVSLIITDNKNFIPYLLTYGTPVLVYIEDEEERHSLIPDIIQDSLYYWTEYQELIDLLQLLHLQDPLKESREYIVNILFDKALSIHDEFKKNLIKTVEQL